MMSPAPLACCSICSAPQRLVWGSDWPVLTLAGDYQDWFELAREAIAAKEESAVPRRDGRQCPAPLSARNAAISAPDLSPSLSVTRYAGGTGASDLKRRTGWRQSWSGGGGAAGAVAGARLSSSPSSPATISAAMVSPPRSRSGRWAFPASPAVLRWVRPRRRTFPPSGSSFVSILCAGCPMSPKCG